MQHPPYSLDLLPSKFFLLPLPNQVSWKNNDSQAITKSMQNNESTDRANEKWFPGMFPKALQSLAKVYHCPLEILWRKCCVNICVINQFRELFKASSTSKITSIPLDVCLCLQLNLKNILNSTEFVYYTVLYISTSEEKV